MNLRNIILDMQVDKELGRVVEKEELEVEGELRLRY